MGTVYTYFEDFTAIVVALTEDISPLEVDLDELFETPWNQAGALDTILRMISIILDHNIRYFPLYRLRNHMADEGEERLADIRSRAARPIIDQLAKQILTKGSLEISTKQSEPEATENARRAAGLLYGMIDRLTVLVVQHPYGDWESSRDQYVQSAARIVHAAVNAP